MDQETRIEFDRVHERVNGVRERVTTIEAQMPHTAQAIMRLQSSVDKLNGNIAKGVWIILALFLTAVFKVAMTGTLTF